MKTKKVRGRPHQREEWIGDAVLVAVLRWHLTEMFPKVSYMVLSDVINYLASNKHLSNFAPVEGAKDAEEIEVWFGNLFTCGKMGELSKMAVNLIRFSTIVTIELDILNAAQTAHDRWSIIERIRKHIGIKPPVNQSSLKPLKKPFKACVERILKEAEEEHGSL